MVSPGIRKSFEFSKIKNKKHLLPCFKKLLEIFKREFNEPEILEKINRLIAKINLRLGKIYQPPEIRKKKKEIVEMVEVEDKYKIDNLKEFQKTALRAGFHLEQIITQEDCYFDLKSLLRKKGQDLRVRRIFDKGGKFINGELKWEGSRGKLQDRPVYEMNISNEEDIEELSRVLQEFIGMIEFMHFKKQRFLYKRKESSGRTTEIELDSFKDKLNPEKIRGKIYAQVAKEVKPTERIKVLEEIQRIAADFGLGRENRDYIEIAAGVERGRLK